ncbi:Oidioi.mRNA.OKI2018_I69.chr1.g2207.t1.cds [Oikopleura dioica]|uniref:Oidioi.mRNA.OKI2018_I69.chr1.g2207.t1.cds n=1 Tax=Oikopleura dioica TaxID=34765 RepID=A0ABN7SQD1_OIKDI|nr:Oidioi.mRNA.OKI2018_I69.chr1.g2207.t1.cds [Oikopleura dioica]
MLRLSRNGRNWKRSLVKAKRIGEVSPLVKSDAKNPELIPRGFARLLDHSQDSLRHIQWLWKKDILGQDSFLIGPPGPRKRWLALASAELSNREVEYLSLSRDTTETDIKQRREIIDGNAVYKDAAAIRAAVNGRILVLDGIERCERNVLPVLNNLLENREVQLEDGRFLMAPSRWDHLVKTGSPEQMVEAGLIRVDEYFRVIALGLPVPMFKGAPLDPPLRSRFQARQIEHSKYHDIKNITEASQKESLSKLLDVGYAINSPEARKLGAGVFPVDMVPRLSPLMNECHTPFALFDRLYPYESGMLTDSSVKSVNGLLASDKLDLPRERHHLSVQSINFDNEKAEINVSGKTGLMSKAEQSFSMPSAASKSSEVNQDRLFYPTGGRQHQLVDILASLSVGDVALIGNRGVGKQTLANEAARLLGQKVEPVLLYQDMSARDLLQQRVTDDKGDTIWRYSPLVNAAIEGRIAIIDGLDRLFPGTLALLNRLTQDREISLHDGTRLVSAETFAEMLSEQKISPAELNEKGINEIHPAFKIIALAEPPTSKTQWLTPEIVPGFLWHQVAPFPQNDETSLLVQSLGVEQSVAADMTRFAHSLRSSTDPALRSIAQSFSTKQLIRVARRISEYPSLNLREELQRAALTNFLPLSTQEALDRQMSSFPAPSSAIKPTQITSTPDSLTIGSVSCSISPAEEPRKVPSPLFYHNDAQDRFDNPFERVLEALLSDWILGEHILLVGNQGVGKNKLADRFLELLQREREYIQLHRDTTIQQLTASPALRDGKLVYEDSPLVKACLNGHVLVIDEADKAPTHVTAVLRSLLECGHIRLPDGRVISKEDDADIKLHPKFRILALANRPGFPFLGNDFFGACGDSFSCFAIDNPSIESEKKMLKSYAPDLEDHILDRLVATFGELRSLADRGQTQYPYSTREAVAIVKHFQKYPEDGLQTACENVFDFDIYNEEASKQVLEVLMRHGIPINARNDDIRLAAELRLSDPPKSQGHCKKETLNVEEANVPFKSWPKAKDHSERRNFFSEQRRSFQLPEYGQSQKPASVAISSDNIISVAVQGPIGVFSHTKPDGIIYFDLWDAFQSGRYGFQPKLNICALPNNEFLVQESVTNQMMVLRPEEESSYRLSPSSTFSSITKFGYSRGEAMPGGVNDPRPDKMMKNFQILSPYSESDGIVWFFSANNPFIHQLTFVEDERPTMKRIDLGILPMSAQAFDKNTLLVESVDGEYWLVNLESGHMQFVENGAPISISPFSKEPKEGEAPETPKRGFVSGWSSAGWLVGAPTADKFEEFQYPRPEDVAGATMSKAHWISPTMVAQLVPPKRVPGYIFTESNPRPLGAGAFIEVTDLKEKKVSYIPVPEVDHDRWWAAARKEDFALGASVSNGTVVTVDGIGNVREFDSCRENLASAMTQWKNMVGQGDGDVRLEYERHSGLDTSSPKHGKEDPKNEPHVGGNTWAGGTGGRDTAGLGGKGGPYRLDKGHDVHQLSDEEKADVPEHVRRAAREQADAALRDRLKEISMSKHDHEAYQQFREPIRNDISNMRALFEGLQAKTKEREWLNNQTDGELDDNKLVEGLVGEKLIYRRRREPDNNDQGFDNQKPKRLTILADCSASMYRFNGTDQRLTRQLESLCMVMEGLDSEAARNKVKWDIVGHSGDHRYIPLSLVENMPKTDKERLKVLQECASHPQFCFPGDNTIEATREQIRRLAADEEADERFLILLTDANLERYGIPIKYLRDALDLDQAVNTCVICIGSLGDQAERMKSELPAGRSYIVKEPNEIPAILRTFFQSTLLKL